MKKEKVIIIGAGPAGLSAAYKLLEKKNQYAKEKTYKYVQTTENFVPYNYQELINTFYTVLDSGTNEFSFYCDKKY